MKERDVTIYKAIENTLATVSLSALYISKTKEYCMVSLQFDDHVIFNNELWDVNSFIFEELYEFLKRWKNGTITGDDLATNIYNDYKAWEWQEDDIDELIDIIEQGIDFGWNKLE